MTRLKSALLALPLIAATLPAGAATITKTFGVFDNNAAFGAPQVVGDFIVEFTGEDLNGNNAIDRTEVTDLTAFYSGLMPVDSMFFSLADLTQFNYEVLQQSPVFLSLELVQPGISNPRAVNSYRVNSTIVRAEDEQGDFHSTNAFILVELVPVPLPAGAALLLGALAGLAVLRRRQQV